MKILVLINRSCRPLLNVLIIEPRMVSIFSATGPTLSEILKLHAAKGRVFSKGGIKNFEVVSVQNISHTICDFEFKIM